MSCASPALQPQLARVDRAALLHRRVQPRNTPSSRTARHSGGVDEGPIRGRIREVLHPVVADALGELEGRLLLLGTPLASGEPRWLQVLARADGLLERRSVRVQRRAIRDLI